MQTKKIRIVAGILIALCAPLVSSADIGVTTYENGKFIMGDFSFFGTSTALQEQDDGMHALIQTLPPNLSGSIGSIMVKALTGDWRCILYQGYYGAPTNIYYATVSQNGAQVLCDFSSYGASFVSTSTYYFLFGRTTYSGDNSSRTVYGSSLQSAFPVEGYDGIVFNQTIDNLRYMKQGQYYEHPTMHTLYLSFSASSSNPSFAPDFASELGIATCGDLDFGCQIKMFFYNLVVPSREVSTDLQWNSTKFETAFPFALFILPYDAIRSLSTISYSTSTNSATSIPLGTGVASSSVVIPSISSAIAPASSVFGSIRSWVSVLWKLFMIMWTLKIVMSITGLAGTYASGGRMFRLDTRNRHGL